MRFSFAALICFFSLALHAQETPKIHQYVFHILGQHFTREEGDHYSERMSAFLTDYDLVKTCIDVKRDILPEKGLGGRVLVFLTQAIPPELYQTLVEYLCEGQPKCSLKGGAAVEEVANLEFIYTWSKAPYYDPKSKEKRRKAAFVGLTGEFPNFSSSCADGKAVDAALGTARSHESRDLLARSGVDIKHTMVLGLQTKAGKLWWNFGQPDLYWNDRPVTKEDQPLAPEDILDQLK